MHAVAPTAARRFVKIGSRPVASLNTDPIRVNTLQTSSSVGMPSIELLGGIAATDPTGVVVVEHGARGLAFALDRGRVVGAFGSGPRGSMQGWAQAARTQEMERAKGTPQRPGVGLVRVFIERCVLDHLTMAHEVGSVLTVLRGDVKWMGTTMEFDRAPRLQHVLMELAREADDRVHIERRLQPSDRVVVPVSAPLQSADDLPAEAEEVDFADLDDGAADEHEVRWSVWSLCDGSRSIEDVAEQCVFGRAPALRALDQLRRRGSIAFEAPAAAGPVAAPVEAAPVEAAPVEAAPVEAAPLEACPVEPQPSVPISAVADAEPIELAAPRRTIRWIGVALGCVAVAAGLFVALQPEATEPPAPRSQPEPSVAAVAPAAALEVEVVAADRPAPLPRGLDALRALSFDERHRRLASTPTRDVAVEDHVGLDLVQAEQSETPCRTFADALSTIEAAADVETYTWALQEAQVPAGHDDACADLDERLSRLRPEAPSKPAAIRRAPRPSRRARAVAPAEPALAEPAVEPEPEPVVEPEPESVVAPNPSVASKLDDGGLKSLE